MQNETVLDVTPVISRTDPTTSAAVLALCGPRVVGAAITAFACTARAHEVEQGPASFATQIQIERFAALNSNPATITTIKADAPDACAYLNVDHIKGAAHGHVQAHGQPPAIDTASTKMPAGQLWSEHS